MRCLINDAMENKLLIGANCNHHNAFLALVANDATMKHTRGFHISFRVPRVPRLISIY